MEPTNISHLMTKEIITVEPDCLFKQAVAIMKQHKISFLIIALNCKPMGVLSERDIVRLACKQVDPDQLQVKDIMTSPVITVAEDTNVFQVYDTLKIRNIRHMVVVDDAGLITGLTTLTNILAGLSIEYFSQLKQVANIMSQNICTLNADDTVQQALELMTEKRISCVIITREKKPIGIITERDITRLYGGTMVKNATVESIMSNPVRTVTPDMFIPQANAIMREENLRHLIIVDIYGNLIGLISQSDVARRIEEHYVGYLRALVKQQDKKLQYEHERFSVLFEQNPNAVISSDIHGNIVDVNQACTLLSGYSEQELAGKTLESFVHPEDVICARESFNKAIKGDTKHAEFRIMQKSGRITHLFNSYLPIYVDNSLHKVYSIMHDISDTKLARQQIRLAEEKAQLLSQAVEDAGDSVIITNSQGTIEFVNSAFTHVTGFTAEEAIGKRPSILKSGKQDQVFYEQMWSSIKNGKAWQSRLVVRRKNGEFYPADLSISPVHNAENEITHFIGIKRDLTEREELEEKFRQSQKMEAIGTLVGGIAHDFNNMLAGIAGNTYLAKKKIKKGNPSEALEKLASIEELSDKAAAMIAQLLTVARKGIVQMQNLSMKLFVKESLKLAQVTIPENIQVIHDVTSEDMSIEGDSTQLQQVFLNLLNNARDAVEDAPDPRIKLKLCRYVPDDNFINRHAEIEAKIFAHLSVSDNGCGIAKEHLDQVFDPFFTTKAVGKGTGLGLSMVYGAVQSHAGLIEIESEQGMGTTFNIYLPLIEKQNEELKNTTMVESVEAKGETILLADDELHVRETTAAILESLGYKVLQAKDGLEAVDIFKAHQGEISLIITDVVMPRLGGLKAVECIREIHPDIKVMFTTGYDKEATLPGNMPSYGSTIFSKPCNIEELSKTIRNQLDS